MCPITAAILALSDRILLFGLQPIASGEIRLKDKVVKIGTAPEAVEAGIAMIPEDRLNQGTVPASGNSPRLPKPWAVGGPPSPSRSAAHRPEIDAHRSEIFRKENFKEQLSFSLMLSIH
jgi:ABC-type uncharacterized transport system ATPase subunit